MAAICDRMTFVVIVCAILVGLTSCRTTTATSRDGGSQTTPMTAAAATDAATAFEASDVTAATVAGNTDDVAANATRTTAGMDRNTTADDAVANTTRTTTTAATAVNGVQQQIDEINEKLQSGKNLLLHFWL